jgi:hypothetical protein
MTNLQIQEKEDHINKQFLNKKTRKCTKTCMIMIMVICSKKVLYRMMVICSKKVLYRMMVIYSKKVLSMSNFLGLVLVQVL